MPERDINLLIGKAVTDRKFEEVLLEPATRALILERGNFTPEEKAILLSIEVQTLKEFAQTCIDRGLVGRETTLDSNSSHHLLLLYPLSHPSGKP